MRVLVVLCCVLALASQEARADLLARAEPEVTTVTGYRNGKPLKLDVIEVDYVLVEVKTARAFIAMRDAAAKDGVELVVWSGFRSNERQAELYDAWKSGTGNPAAKPGYSNHQSGRALDINLLGVPPEVFAWLKKNAGKFGFRRTVPKEPWHWEYTAPRRSSRR